MKKLCSLLLSLALCAALAACGASGAPAVSPSDAPSASPSAAPTAAAFSPAPVSEESAAAQLRLIAGAADTWRIGDESDGWGYAVTDLDGNGRLELISSELHGTGFFSTNRIWEVTAALDGLAEVTQTIPEGDSQADLLTAETLPVYTDDAGGVRYFVFTDGLRNGAAEYYESLRALSLRDGALTDTTLASKSTLYDTAGNPTVTCQDAAGSAITEAQYAAAADTYFSGLTKQQAAIFWIGSVHIADLGSAELLSALQTSWAGFSVG